MDEILFETIMDEEMKGQYAVGVKDFENDTQDQRRLDTVNKG